MDEGVGAKANRLIPGNIGHLDPFVIFDEYRIFPGAHFPEHPHGGFEGFQVLTEGRTIYRDNQGNEGSIGPGDVRRFVAGEGFRHSEEPDFNGTVKGYLLWIKIPASKKATPIIFNESRAETIPIREDKGFRIRTIIGPGSPVDTMTPVLWEIIEGYGRGTFDISLEDDENGFVYVSAGNVIFDGEKLGPGDAVIMNGPVSKTIGILGKSEIVNIKGKRLGEDIVQEDHFVK
jgi:redox-sensitive bicupin YhaK (pirin superfamily)